MNCDKYSVPLRVMSKTELVLQMFIKLKKVNNLPSNGLSMPLPINTSVSFSEAVEDPVAVRIGDTASSVGVTFGSERALIVSPTTWNDQVQSISVEIK